MSRRCANADLERVRQPPANIEAEQALLGAILVNNAAYHRVVRIPACQSISPNAVHGRIYAAIGKLIERGQIANPVTLKNLFDQDGALAEIGGAQYLARLADSAVTIINAEDYGRTIHDLHLRRQLITIGEDVVNDAFQHDLDDAAVAADRAGRSRSSSTSPTTGQSEGGFRPFSKALGRGHRAWPRPPSSASGRTIGVATGFHRSRQAAGRAAPLRSGHPRRPALDGQDRARHQYRLQRRQGLSRRARRGRPDHQPRTAR